MYQRKRKKTREISPRKEMISSSAFIDKMSVRDFELGTLLPFIF